MIRDGLGLLDHVVKSASHDVLWNWRWLRCWKRNVHFRLAHIWLSNIRYSALKENELLWWICRLIVWDIVAQALLSRRTVIARSFELIPAKEGIVIAYVLRNEEFEQGERSVSRTISEFHELSFTDSTRHQSVVALRYCISCWKRCANHSEPVPPFLRV